MLDEVEVAKAAVIAAAVPIAERNAYRTMPILHPAARNHQFQTIKRQIHKAAGLAATLMPENAGVQQS